MAFAYRSSLLKQQLAAGAAQPVVLRRRSSCMPGDAVALAARADSYLARRRASQPVEPSAGSIFRNPPGDYAGRLVEAVGLKGQRIGGAHSRRVTPTSSSMSRTPGPRMSEPCWT